MSPGDESQQDAKICRPQEREIDDGVAQAGERKGNQVRIGINMHLSFHRAASCHHSQGLTEAQTKEATFTRCRREEA
jgi:hypothetical protein